MAIAGGATRTVVESISGDSVICSHDETHSNYTSPSAVTVTGTDVIATTFADDGTSYANQAAYDAAWISSNTGLLRGNPTTDLIDQTIGSDGGSNFIYKDIGQVFSSTFVFRFSVKKVSGSGQFPVFGITSTNTGIENAADFIMMYIGNGAGDNLWTEFGDGVAALSGTQADSGYSMGTSIKYIEIIGLSSTSIQIKIYSDSAYTTQVGSTQSLTIPSTCTGFRYFKISERIINNASTGVLEYDNFKFYDGRTTVPTYGAANLIDGSTSNYWKYTAVNPALYVDMGSAVNSCAIAIYLHSDTTETSIKIRANSSASFSDSNLLRTITVTNLVAGAWNYIRYNVIALQYIQIYGASGSSKVLAISDVKVLVKTDAQLKLTHGHLSIDETSALLDLDGT